MGKQEFAASRAEGGAHHRLARMAGDWEGTTRVWFDPTQPPASEAPQSGRIRRILDGRFLLHDYETSFGDESQQGLVIYGLHLDAQTFESAWADSFHTGTSIMYSTAPAICADYTVLGSYGDGQGGPPWGWRTSIEQPDDDTLVITMTNISPQGEEAKAVETRYTRKR